jgi:hypothetical protein
MIAALLLNYRSSPQIPRIEAAPCGLGHDNRVLVFGKIGNQPFQRNRRVPKNCGGRNHLNFEDVLLVPYLLSTVSLGLYLHAPSVLPAPSPKAILGPTNRDGEESSRVLKIAPKNEKRPCRRAAFSLETKPEKVIWGLRPSWPSAPCPSWPPASSPPSC